jgi:four helix bundle protein
LEFEFELQLFLYPAAERVAKSAEAIIPFERKPRKNLGKSCGLQIALAERMKEPSPKRKRTLELHERALRFTNDVLGCCPTHFTSHASSRVWDQLVRASDGTSNNLIEADGGSSDADFLSKMSIALREAKESRAALMKVRVCGLDNSQKTAQLNLESEASQLSAIFATIILNMRRRLEEEDRNRKKKKGDSNSD